MEGKKQEHILQLATSGDHTLIALLDKTNEQVKQYCVAYLFDSETNTWEHGHYFGMELKNAIDYLPER